MAEKDEIPRHQTYVLGPMLQQYHHPIKAGWGGHSRTWVIHEMDYDNWYKLPYVLEKHNVTRSFDWPTVPLARRTKKPVQFSGGNPSSFSINFIMDATDYPIDRNEDLLYDMSLCEALGSHPLELYMGIDYMWEVVMESVSFEIESWHPNTYNPNRVVVTMNFKERA